MELVQALKLIANGGWHGLGTAWVERQASDAAYEIEQLRLKVADYEAAYGGVAVTKSK